MPTPCGLAQVLGNLLNNAGKFTDKGGRVRLMVEQDDGEVVIRVADNGIGIAAGTSPRPLRDVRAGRHIARALP